MLCFVNPIKHCDPLHGEKGPGCFSLVCGVWTELSIILDLLFLIGQWSAMFCDCRIFLILFVCLFWAFFSFWLQDGWLLCKEKRKSSKVKLSLSLALTIYIWKICDSLSENKINAFCRHLICNVLSGLKSQRDWNNNYALQNISRQSIKFADMYKTCKENICSLYPKWHNSDKIYLQWQENIRVLDSLLYQVPETPVNCSDLMTELQSESSLANERRKTVNSIYKPHHGKKSSVHLNRVIRAFTFT